MGKQTSHFWLAETSWGAATVSSCAADCTIVQENGRLHFLTGPKFTCKLTLRSTTCGKSGFPWKRSGIGCGDDIRTPSRNKLTVFALGESLSKFSTKVRTASRVNFLFASSVCLPSHMKTPSESKQKPSSLSPSTRVEPLKENPIRSACLGCGAFCRIPGPVVSGGVNSSRMVTSNMYRPPVRPTLARAPPMIYCRPPSLKAIRMVPCDEGKTFMVVSRVWKQIGSLRDALVSSGASSSSSPTGSSTTGTGAGGGGISAASCTGASDPMLTSPTPATPAGSTCMASPPATAGASDSNPAATLSGAMAFASTVGTATSGGPRGTEGGKSITWTG
mmetsp:Transcript_29359/g.68363  ORF Transcript_29359/g.68363 Transcript_29359/m.68363 type:complete len:333 (-) Transcript_29359:279-1277(-)